MGHEEEYKRREGEVMEQNKQILREKIELENSLRIFKLLYFDSFVEGVISSLEQANAELRNELVKIRLEYKISVFC